MYIVKYSARDLMANDARACEYIHLNSYFMIGNASTTHIQIYPTFHISAVDVYTIIFGGSVGYSCTREAPPLASRNGKRR